MLRKLPRVVWVYAIKLCRLELLWRLLTLPTLGIVQCRDGGLDFFMLKSASIRDCLRGISWVVLASSAKRILMDNFGLLGFWTLLERDIEVFMTKITLSLRVIVILSSPQNRKKNRTLRESCLFLEKCGRYTLRKRSWWRAKLLHTFFERFFFQNTRNSSVM